MKAQKALVFLLFGINAPVISKSWHLHSKNNKTEHRLQVPDFVTFVTVGLYLLLNVNIAEVINLRTLSYK